jgi:hypothetical protein
MVWLGAAACAKPDSKGLSLDYPDTSTRLHPNLDSADCFFLQAPSDVAKGVQAPILCAES